MASMRCKNILRSPAEPAKFCKLAGKLFASEQGRGSIDDVLGRLSARGPGGEGLCFQVVATSNHKNNCFFEGTAGGCRPSWLCLHVRECVCRFLPVEKLQVPF